MTQSVGATITPMNPAQVCGNAGRVPFSIAQTQKDGQEIQVLNPADARIIFFYSALRHDICTEMTTTTNIP